MTTLVPTKPPPSAPPPELSLGWNKVLVGTNVGFFILLLIGAIIVFSRSGPTVAPPSLKPFGVVANRSLPINHLIQEKDLTINKSGPSAAATGDQAKFLELGAQALSAKLVGRYVVRAIGKGEAIDPKRVATLPDISLSGGAIAVGLAVDRKLVDEGRINALTETIACSGQTQIGTRSYSVQAVQCPAKGDACTAMILMPPDRRGEVALFGPGLAPRLSPQTCEIGS